jgi:hypothetical protein
MKEDVGAKATFEKKGDDENVFFFPRRGPGLPAARPQRLR